MGSPLPFYQKAGVRTDAETMLGLRPDSAAPLRRETSVSQSDLRRRLEEAICCEAGNKRGGEADD